MRINPKLMSTIYFGGWIVFVLSLIMPILTPLWISEYVLALIIMKKLIKREQSIYDVWDENGDE